MTSPALNYDLVFDERRDYLYACITAPAVNLHLALDYLSEVVDRCARVRCKKLLLERDVPTTLNDSDMWVAVNELVRLSPGVKIAFVSRHVTVADALKHAIGKGVTQGADHKYFDDPMAAEKWLLK